VRQEKVSLLTARLVASFVASAVLSLTGGCVTRDSDGGKPLCMQVMHLKADVRYSKNGKSWTRLQHSELLAGSVIKMGEDSYLQMSVARPANEPPQEPRRGRIYVYMADYGTLYHEQTEPEDSVILFPNSVLSLERLTWRKDKGMPGPTVIARNVRLELRDGSIFGFVVRRTNASTFEVRFPNGNFHTGGGCFELSSSGALEMLEGKGTISLVGTAKGVEIVAGHGFDPASGAVSTLTASDLSKHRRPIHFPDEDLVKKEVQTRPFILPQRKF
jgi:hypothetical protein